LPEKFSGICQSVYARLRHVVYCLKSMKVKNVWSTFIGVGRSNNFVANIMVVKS